MRTDKSNKQIHVDFSPLSKIFVIEILNNFSINRIMINWDSGHCQIDQKSKNVKFIAKTMYSDLLMKQNMFNENTIKFNMPYTPTEWKYLPQMSYAFRFLFRAFLFYSVSYHICKHISIYVCECISNTGRLNYVAYELEFLPLKRAIPLYFQSWKSLALIIKFYAFLGD